MGLMPIIRYFLLREVPFGLDGDFSHTALIHRINSDLANDLGNLVSRSTAMLSKYFDGTLPAATAFEEIDDPFIKQFPAAVKTVDEQMNALAFNKALQTIWTLISASNKYIDESAPWTLAKDETQKERLGTVMYNLLEAVRIIALLVAPFLPDTGASILNTLGDTNADITLNGQDVWGGLQAGTTIEKAQPLFPRIETQ